MLIKFCIIVINRTVCTLKMSAFKTNDQQIRQHVPGQPYCAPGYTATKNSSGKCLCKFPQYSVAIPCGDRPPSCTSMESLDYGAVFETMPNKHSKFHSGRYQS